MLKFALSCLPSKTIQNICNVCAHQLFKRKYWRTVNSNHTELQCPEGVKIEVCKIEKWEWKVKDRLENELCHGISPTESMAILDGHLWIELLENDKKCSNITNSAEI